MILRFFDYRSSLFLKVGNSLEITVRSFKLLLITCFYILMPTNFCLFVCLAALRGLWYLSSLTRMNPCPSVEAPSPNHWTQGIPQCLRIFTRTAFFSSFCEPGHCITITVGMSYIISQEN